MAEDKAVSWNRSRVFLASLALAVVTLAGSLFFYLGSDEITLASGDSVGQEPVESMAVLPIEKPHD